MSENYFSLDTSVNIYQFLDIAEGVCTLNQMFGNKRDYSETAATSQAVVKQRHLMLEEIVEMRNAFEKRDHVQVLDGIGDFLTVYYGEHYLNPNTELPVFKIANHHVMTQPDEGGRDVLMDRFKRLCCSITHIENCLRYLSLNSDWVGDSEFCQDFTWGLGELFSDFVAFSDVYLKEYFGGDVSLQGIYTAVHESNMSKFFNFTEVTATLDMYKKKGYPTEKLDVEAVSANKMKVYVKESFEFDGKFFPEGKFLKGVNFQEPDFSWQMEQYIPH